MKATQTGTDEKKQKSATYKAEELARDIIADYQNFDLEDRDLFKNSFAEWLPKVELDPTMIIAVVGYDPWKRSAAEFLRRIMLSRHGKAMVDIKNETNTESEAAKGARVTRTVQVELGILGKVLIGNKPLAFCTKAEVLIDQKHSQARASFLAAIANLLPNDGAVVQDFVTPKVAKRLSTDAGFRV